MNLNEKTIARKDFNLKIHTASGQAFEDLFSRIMYYYDTEFQQIKPWGKLGDRKNDGYIRSKGIYYQVYAPEDSKNSYPAIIKKINDDFKGLLTQWENVQEFYFVINDKYRGVKIINSLNYGYYLVPQLESYLKNNSDFLADSLRDKMFSIYQLNKKTKTGKKLFWDIVNEASPKKCKKYQDSVIVIMAKYFETCDIFENPPKD